MECVEGCEFIKFDRKKKRFRCGYYDKGLKTKVSNDEICILRCGECIENGVIHKEEKLSVIREQIGHTNDEFYAFKEKFEETMVLVLELLQKLEDNNEEKLKLLQKLEDNNEEK